MERTKPYIGITGARNGVEVINLKTNFLKDLGWSEESSEYCGMIGFLFSRYKLQSDSSLEKLAYLLDQSSSDNTLAFVHYYSNSTGKGLENEITQMIEELNRSDTSPLQGLQLNIPWPDARIFEKLKDVYGLKTVLQLGPKVMTEIVSDSVIKHRLDSYSNNIDYVLIDTSGGRGKSLDFVQAERFSSLVDEVFSDDINKPIKIFAGGISADNVLNMITSISQFSGQGFGVDAQKKLMNVSGSIDINQAELYIRRASQALR